MFYSNFLCLLSSYLTRHMLKCLWCWCSILQTQALQLYFIADNNILYENWYNPNWTITSLTRWYWSTSGGIVQLVSSSLFDIYPPLILVDWVRGLGSSPGGLWVTSHQWETKRIPTVNCNSFPAYLSSA